MLKLKELKAKQQAQQQAQQQQQTAAPASESSSKEPEAQNNPTGFALKRQPSKELADTRRQKSKENVFSLGGSNRKEKKKKPNAAEIRVHKDLSEMQPVSGTRLDFPNPDDLMAFMLYVKATDGLWKNAEYKFTVHVPSNYPYDPPKVVCETPIYHPNIDTQGHVCLNILRADWMPVLNLGAVIFGVVTLFLEPNPEDPLNKEAAKLMLENRSSFDRNVRQSLQGGYVDGKQYPKLL